MRDAVDDLLWDEAPRDTMTVALINTPHLVDSALSLGATVRVFCDDFRDAVTVDPALLVNTPTELNGADLFLARLPKSLGELEEYASAAQNNEGVRFLAGGRIKHMNRSMNTVLARYFVDVSASLGRSKARVLRATSPTHLRSGWPQTRFHEDLGFAVSAHGGTFAGTRVDAGTRLLLRAMEKHAVHPHVSSDKALDFGCGNGVLSMWLASVGWQVSAVDVSWAACDATRLSAHANHARIEVLWADGLSTLTTGDYSLIVTNPPFHRGTAKDSSDTFDMVRESSRVLTPGGQLWCVFNSHLPYLRALRSHVGATEIVAQDRNYTVAVATRNCG